MNEIFVMDFCIDIIPEGTWPEVVRGCALLEKSFWPGPRISSYQWFPALEKFGEKYSPKCKKTPPFLQNFPFGNRL